MYDDMRSRFDNVTFNIDTPDGNANIILVEESPGKICNIFFLIGKAGTNVNGWAFALAETVADSLKRGSDINDMIALLSNITSARPVYDKEGRACRSGPEALMIALMRYRNMNHEKESTKVKYRDNYTPPKLGHK